MKKMTSKMRRAIIKMMTNKNMLLRYQEDGGRQEHGEDVLPQEERVKEAGVKDGQEPHDGVAVDSGNDASSAMHTLQQGSVVVVDPGENGGDPGETGAGADPGQEARDDVPMPMLNTTHMPLPMLMKNQVAQMATRKSGRARHQTLRINNS